MTERWLSTEEAVVLIQARLSRSTGHAQATLTAALKSGEVREVRHKNPVLLMADDGIVGMDILPNGRRLPPGRSISTAQISESDLLDWLDHTHGKPAPASTPKGRAQSKRDRAKQAIGALWPKGIPSEAELSHKNLIQKVARWIADDCKGRQLPADTPGNDTILRAAGRK